MPASIHAFLSVAACVQLSGCVLITDAGLCGNVSAAGMTTHTGLVSGCRHLTRLVLRGCVRITDKAALRIGEGCPGLSHADAALSCPCVLDDF